MLMIIYGEVAMTLQGRVANGVVVFENMAAPLPDGTLVEITPVLPEEANGPKPVGESKARRDSLLDLIGICKVGNPPDDEEVEWIIEEYRMKKYG